MYEYYFTKVNNSLSNYHAGEMTYAYGNLDRMGGRYAASDYALSDMMTDYWANFVKTGDPNGAGLPQWEARSAESERLLRLDAEICMVDDPYQDIYLILDKYQADYRNEEESGGETA